MSKKESLATFEIEGYHAVLLHVQNVYGVEKELDYWFWGFKYTSQVFEYFSYRTLEEAQKVHDEFIEAINLYWKEKN